MKTISEIKFQDERPSKRKLRGEPLARLAKHISSIKGYLVAAGTVLLGTVLTGCMTLGGI